MLDLIRGRSAKAGMEPGALVYVGEERAQPATIDVIEYDAGHCSERRRQAGDVFDGVRAALQTGKGRARASGSDYLAYLLVDAVVDGYFTMLEGLAERIDDLEDAILAQPDPEVVASLHGLKRELVYLRNS